MPQTYAAIREPKPEAIVIYCSDPRFQNAFLDFISQELNLPQGSYMPLVVGGGAGVLAHPERLPKEFKFMRERVEFYREIMPSIKRVILINHQDCRYYASLKERVLDVFVHSHKTHDVVAQEDLKLVQSVMMRLLAHLGLSFEMYYAKFADPAQTQIVFERIG